MNPTLRKLARIPFSRKLLLFRISLLMAAVHLGLRIAPFARVYGVVRRFHRPPRRPISPHAASELSWAVGRAGYAWMKDEGCLVQAMIGEALLIRGGIPAKMVIGVRREGAQTMAHAWVESGGVVVVGQTGGSQKSFQKLPDFQAVIQEGRDG